MQITPINNSTSFTGLIGVSRKAIKAMSVFNPDEFKAFKSSVHGLENFTDKSGMNFKVGYQSLKNRFVFDFFGNLEKEFIERFSVKRGKFKSMNSAVSEFKKIQEDLEITTPTEQLKKQRQRLTDNILKLTKK